MVALLEVNGKGGWSGNVLMLRRHRLSEPALHHTLLDQAALNPVLILNPYK